jgi:hypothetical protein
MFLLRPAHAGCKKEKEGRIMNGRVARFPRFCAVLGIVAALGLSACGSDDPALRP